MSSRASMAAALLLDLRTPLARLSLSAQRMDRAAIRPADHALAAGMQDAVREIDARIDRILPLLVEVEPDSSVERRSATRILEQLVERLRPALDARDVGLALVPGHATSEVELETHGTRRLGATLIQHGIEWAGRGGQLELDVMADAAPRPTLVLHCVRAEDGVPPDSLCEADFVVGPELQAQAEHVRVTHEGTRRVRVVAGIGARA